MDEDYPFADAADYLVLVSDARLDAAHRKYAIDTACMMSHELADITKLTEFAAWIYEFLTARDASDGPPTITFTPDGDLAKPSSNVTKLR